MELRCKGKRVQQEASSTWVALQQAEQLLGHPVQAVNHKIIHAKTGEEVGEFQINGKKDKEHGATENRSRIG